MSDTLSKPHAITKGHLAQFTGTNKYHKWWGGLVLTDGAHFLATNGAAWLIDILASVRNVPAIRSEAAEIWKLTVDLEKHSATIVCTDGNSDTNIHYQQNIPFTDFPLPELTIYVNYDHSYGKVVLLPSEY